MSDIYDDYAAELSAKLRAAGFGEARDIVDLATGSMESMFGSSRVYFPSRQAIRIRHRDAAIRREFTGNNVDAVCAKFRVSRRTVYRVVGGKGK